MTNNLTYPKNLIFDVMGNALYCNIDIDQLDAISHLTDFLNYNEKIIIRFIYEAGRTIKYTAKEFGISCYEMRHALDSIIKKIRSDRFMMNMIIDGINKDRFTDYSRNEFVEVFRDVKYDTIKKLKDHDLLTVNDVIVFITSFEHVNDKTWFDALGIPLMDYVKIETSLKKRGFYHAPKEEKMTNKSKLKEKEYPLNLFLDILPEEYPSEKITIISPAQIDSMEYYIKTFLPERYVDMIHQRYFDRKTLSEIGKGYKVSRSRVDAIIKKGIRQVRYHYRNIVDGVIPEEKPLIVDKDIPVEDTSIEDLMLSVRSYNCLKRAGYETVGDIIKVINGFEETSLYKHWYNKIRNCGTKSAAEVQDKLINLGVDIKRDPVLISCSNVIGCANYQKFTKCKTEGDVLSLLAIFVENNNLSMSISDIEQWLLKETK